jgi:hypothetical protein
MRQILAYVTTRIGVSLRKEEKGPSYRFLTFDDVTEIKAVVRMSRSVLSHDNKTLSPLAFCSGGSYSRGRLLFQQAEEWGAKGRRDAASSLFQGAATALTDCDANFLEARLLYAQAMFLQEEVANRPEQADFNLYLELYEYGRRVPFNKRVATALWMPLLLFIAKRWAARSNSKLNGGAVLREHLSLVCKFASALSPALLTTEEAKPLKEALRGLVQQSAAVFEKATAGMSSTDPRLFNMLAYWNEERLHELEPSECDSADTLQSKIWTVPDAAVEVMIHLLRDLRSTCATLLHHCLEKGGQDEDPKVQSRAALVCTLLMHFDRMIPSYMLDKTPVIYHNDAVLHMVLCLGARLLWACHWRRRITEADSAPRAWTAPRWRSQF